MRRHRNVPARTAVTPADVPTCFERTWIDTKIKRISIQTKPTQMTTQYLLLAATDFSILWHVFFSRYLAFFPRNMYWFSHYWIYIFGLTKEENRIKYHCIGNCWLAFSLNLISTTYSLIMLECSSIDINGQLVGECGMDFAFVWSFSRIFRCEGLLLMFCRLPYCSFRIRTIIFVFAYRIFFFLVIV